MGNKRTACGPQQFLHNSLSNHCIRAKKSEQNTVVVSSPIKQRWNDPVLPLKFVDSNTFPGPTCQPFLAPIPVSSMKIAYHRKSLSKTRRLIVKLGSGVLTTSSGHLSPSQIRNLASQVRKLAENRVEVILVSSGAIAAGMARLRLKTRPSGIHDLQACAAIGQNLLMHHYETAFSRVGLMVGQVLLTHGDFRDDSRRENARSTLLRLLKLGVIPVINENDAVSFAEIKFGDNDELAALVHQLVHADAAILLSTVDGFYVRHGRRRDLIPTIPAITPSVLRHAGDTASKHSVGGMKSKLLAARRVTATGKPLVVAGGKVKNVLPRLLKGEELGTIFLPRPLRAGTRRRR
jgi:glutamate 5-kinase